MGFPFGGGSKSSDSTSILLTVGGVAALIGIGYYAYQQGLLGPIFDPPKTVDTGAEIDDTPVTTTPTTTQPTTTTGPTMPPGGWPQPDYYNIFNPQIKDEPAKISSGNDNDNDSEDDIPDFVEIDRGTSKDDTGVVTSSECKKCYDDCNGKRASSDSSLYKKCQSCGEKCGYKVRRSDGRIRLTDTQANMALAMVGQYYDGRVRDQSYILTNVSRYGW